MQKLTTYSFLYPFVWFLKKSKHLSAISCRLVQLTGRSKYQIHPKHLIETEKQWYFRDIIKSDIVLDLGCGNGQHTVKIAKKCKKIIGIDNNDNQLKVAKKTAIAKNMKNISFLNYNLEKKLPLINNSFDKIFCLDVLEHLRNREQFLAEINRLLKPKGIAFIAVPNKNTSWKKLQRKTGLNFYSDPDHKIEYSLNKIKKILSKAKFKILNIKPIVYDTPWAGLIDLVGGINLNLYCWLSLWKKNKVKHNLEESAGFFISVFKIKQH